MDINIKNLIINTGGQIKFRNQYNSNGSIVEIQLKRDFLKL